MQNIIACMQNILLHACRIFYCMHAEYSIACMQNILLHACRIFYCMHAVLCMQCMQSANLHACSACMPHACTSLEGLSTGMLAKKDSVESFFIFTLPPYILDKNSKPQGYLHTFWIRTVNHRATSFLFKLVHLGAQGVWCWKTEIVMFFFCPWSFWIRTVNHRAIYLHTFCIRTVNHMALFPVCL
jgi:hypothetical protein